jgi:hypothetical protein
VSLANIKANIYVIQNSHIDGSSEKANKENLKVIVMFNIVNGTARFKKHKQLFEYKHLLLLRDIWWSDF